MLSFQFTVAVVCFSLMFSADRRSNAYRLGLQQYRSELFLSVLDKGSIRQNTALVEQALQTFFGVHQGVVVRIQFLKIGFFVVMYVNERNDWHYHRIARVRHIRSDVFWSDFCANRRQFLEPQILADEVVRFPLQHFISPR